METILARLVKEFPHLSFIAGRQLCWSPNSHEIIYEIDNVKGLLHELGHALLAHTSYKSDVELLKKEVEAWEKAKGLAGQYGVVIDDAHIQDCLDTYRDWLHKRSRCPSCESQGVQLSLRQYSCLNCRETWQVSATRFCRPYRLTTQP